MNLARVSKGPNGATKASKREHFFPMHAGISYSNASAVSLKIPRQERFECQDDGSANSSQPR